MDIGCSCICSDGGDYAPSVYRAKMVKARKEHTCYECRETIKPGEMYENASGIWDGEWDHYKTCELCVRIRESVCCGSWIFGELRERIWEEFGLDYVTGRTMEDDDAD